MKDKQVSFVGQIIYVGIDVHKKNWVVTIIIGGLIMKTESLNPDPEDLCRYLQKHYPGGEYHTVYEAGFCGFWIDRILRSRQIKNIVINPADVPTTHKEKSRKDDKIDSRKLAKELSIGNLEGIYIPSEEDEAFRSLTRLRSQLVKDHTRLKNRIKSLLDFSGEKLPPVDELKHWSSNFMKYLSELKLRNNTKKITLLSLINTLQPLRQQIAQVLKEIRKVVRENKELKETIDRLESVPGIGFITAVTLRAEIIDINRFKTIEQLASYSGLIPDTRSSGEKERATGLTARKNSHIRSLVIEAAWVAAKKDPALSAVFGKLTLRMKKQNAIIRIAKKLINRIMHVWREKENYILAVVQ